MASQLKRSLHQALFQSANATNELEALERAFEKLSAELATTPAVSVWRRVEQALRAGRAQRPLLTGKEVEFEVRGETLKLDETLCTIFADPLVHLVRNAVDHGIEASEERVETWQKSAWKDRRSKSQRLKVKPELQ